MDMNFAMKDVADAAEEELKKLLPKGVNCKIVRDNELGTVQIIGFDAGAVFTYANQGLALMGYCQKCQQEVPSKKIKRFADIVDLRRSFVPGRHDCGDV